MENHSNACGEERKCSINWTVGESQALYKNTNGKFCYFFVFIIIVDVCMWCGEVGHM